MHIQKQEAPRLAHEQNKQHDNKKHSMVLFRFLRHFEKHNNAKSDPVRFLVESIIKFK